MIDQSLAGPERKQGVFAQLLIGGLFRWLAALVVLYLITFTINQFRPWSTEILIELSVRPVEHNFRSWLLFSVVAPAMLAFLTLLVFIALERLFRFRMVNTFFVWVESEVVTRFPLLGDIYGAVKRIVDMVSKPMQRNAFGEVVIVVDDAKLTWRYGFKTGEINDIVSVFVPFGPVFTHGPIIQIHRSNILPARIQKTELASDLLALGSGAMPNKLLDCAAVQERWVEKGLHPRRLNGTASI